MYIKPINDWEVLALRQTETEGFIAAAQDQSIFTRNFQANILHNGANSTCRFCNTSNKTTDQLIPGNILHNGADPTCKFCNTSNKTTDQLISGCMFLPQIRHNRVGHWKISNNDDIERPDKWYEYETLPVVDTPKVTIFQEFPIRTDRTIQDNSSDIVIKHKKNKACQLIDMSVSSDRNNPAKQFEKLSKYKDLEIEIAKKWKMKTKTIPVIVGHLTWSKREHRMMLMKFQEMCLLLKLKK